jgi:ankyrin repeat protein
VKSGDRDRLSQELMRYNIEVRDVVDVGQFNQNLAFTCCQIEDESKAVQMLELMANMGVDIFQRDNLKQTPLFYACKNSRIQLIQLLIENGLSVNEIDTYGQNPIYYGCAFGNLETVQLLIANGSNHDVIDENGQTPLYYAIKNNNAGIVECLLQNGCNLEITDKRGLKPINFAVRHNKQAMKELLLKYGATPPPDPKSKKAEAKKVAVPAQPVKRINERLVPKEFVLQICDKGVYRPITDEEFDLLKKELPNIAELFEDETAIERMKIPSIDESAPIQFHWEKVAKRMMTHLMKMSQSWIFLEPVDPHKFNLTDYFDIIAEPMDFGTIKEKLTHHSYLNMHHFLQDVELVFSNCILYNGENSQVSKMCQEVEAEYRKQCESLHVGFYLTGLEN